LELEMRDGIGYSSDNPLGDRFRASEASNPSPAASDLDSFGDAAMTALKAQLTPEMIGLYEMRCKTNSGGDQFIPLVSIDPALKIHAAFMEDQLKLTTRDIQKALAKPFKGLPGGRPESTQINALQPQHGYDKEIRNLLTEIQVTYKAFPSFAVRHDTSDGHKIDLGLIISTTQPANQPERAAPSRSSLSKGPTLGQSLSGTAKNTLELLAGWYLKPTADRIARESGKPAPDDFISTMHQAFGWLTAAGTALSWELPTSYLGAYLLATFATNVASGFYERGRKRYIKDQREQERERES
jgi:hypothetical protein